MLNRRRLLLKGMPLHGRDGALEIVLLGPIGGETVDDLHPEFTWNAFDGATTYDIEVATDSGFTNIVLSDTGIAATNWTATASLGPGAHYWRVTSDNGGESATGTFTMLVFEFSVTTTGATQTLTIQLLGVAAAQTVNVEWGDGTANDAYTGTATRTHVYATAGTYVVRGSNSGAVTIMDIRDAKVTYQLNFRTRDALPNAIDFRFENGVIPASNIADAPRVTSIFSLNGSGITVGGDIADAPRVTNTFSLNGSGITVGGDIADAPRVTSIFYLSGNDITVGGDIADAPRVTSIFRLNGSGITVGGDIADAPRVTNIFYLNGSGISISGTASGIPAATAMTILVNGGTSTIEGGGSAVVFTRIDNFNFNDLNWLNGRVNGWIDRLYTDRTLITTGARTVFLAGNNEAPSTTPQIDTYIPALTTANIFVTYTTP